MKLIVLVLFALTTVTVGYQNVNHDPLCDGDMCYVDDFFRNLDHKLTLENTKKPILRAVQTTRDPYVPCVTPCDINASTCHTLLQQNEPCEKNSLTYYSLQSLVSSSDLCATPCVYRNSSTKATCYDVTSNLQECIPFPDKRRVITDATKSVNVFGAIKSDGKYIVCPRNCDTPVKDELRRRRWLNFYDEDVNISDLLQRYAPVFPEHINQFINPNNMVDPNVVDPIVSYSMVPIPGVTLGTQAFLPLTVSALITPHTRPATRRRGNRLNVDTSVNYANMDPAPRDERCHIIAHRFNGPTLPHNIFPCTWDQNRGQDSVWNNIERMIARFVDNGVNRYVEFTAVLSYDFDAADYPMRPNAVAVRLRLYNDQHVQCDSTGTPLAGATNPYENMYFNNHPDYCCSSEILDLN